MQISQCRKIPALRRLSLAILSTSLFLSTGCTHRPPGIQPSYTLQGSAGYMFLVPSLSSSAEGNFQTSTVTLGKTKVESNRASRSECTLTGPVFSFTPSSSSSNQWIVRTPNVQGWQNLGDQIDLKSEWLGFTQGLLHIQRLGCLPADETQTAIIQSIAEVMPIQTSETLLFFYSFGGTGFADLSPGMQLRVEQTQPEDRTSGHIISSFAQYEIVQVSSSGVALQLSKQSHLPSGASLQTEDHAGFRLQNRFAARTMFRLFLQSSRPDGSQQDAILIGATTASELNEATRQIQESGLRTCPANLSSSTDCVRFEQGTAVSLLASIWINGRLSYRSFGFTLGQVLELLPVNEQPRAIATFTLQRPLRRGGYANIVIARNPDATEQIILLPGDRITWKH